MPYRKVLLVPDCYYHVFNRSVGRQPILHNLRDYQRLMQIIEFYAFDKPSLRFSHYNRLPTEAKTKYLANLKKESKKIVEIIGFCLMPNHFHFLVKEKEKGGIARFMRNIQNSYAKYFNTKNDRNGALFQSMFKAVRIETDEQLIHVLRYIHLNPLTSFIIKEIKELESYPFTSFFDYILKRENSFVDTSMMKGFFKSVDSLAKFTFDQVNYQRELEEIKHLLLE